MWNCSQANILSVVGIDLGGQELVSRRREVRIPVAWTASYLVGPAKAVREANMTV